MPEHPEESFGSDGGREPSHEVSPEDHPSASDLVEVTLRALWQFFGEDP